MQNTLKSLRRNQAIKLPGGKRMGLNAGLVTAVLLTIVLTQVILLILVGADTQETIISKVIKTAAFFLIGLFCIIWARASFDTKTRYSWGAIAIPVFTFGTMAILLWL